MQTHVCRMATDGAWVELMKLMSCGGQTVTQRLGETCRVCAEVVTEGSPRSE